MTALAQAFSRFSANTNLEADILKILAMFSAPALLCPLSARATVSISVPNFSDG